MISDVRVAQIINSTMVSIIAILILACSIWIFSAQFQYVRVIYTNLSSEDRRHISAFFNSLFVFLLVGSFIARSIRARFSRRKTPQAAN
jgi:hypothetical protein